MKNSFKIFALASFVAFFFTPNSHGQQYWQKDIDVPNVLWPTDPSITRVYIGPTSFDWGFGRTHIEHNSDGATNAHLTLRETETSDYARLQFMNSSATARWQISGKTNTTASSAQMNFYFHNGISGNDLMTIKGDGKVGIGTNAPTTNLHVKTTGGNPIYMESSSADNWLGFKTGSTEKGYAGVKSADNDMDFATSATNTTGNINLITSSSSTSTGKINLTTKGFARLTVQSDGLVVANHKICIGTTAPLDKLTIAGGGLALVPSSGTAYGISSVNSYMQFNSYSGLTATGRIGMNTNSFVPLNDDVMYLGASGKRWKEVWAGNGTIQTSDQSVKKNIKHLQYGLKEVLQMKPVSYQWKNEEAGRTNLGFLAQEIEKIVPEVVVHADPVEGADQGTSNATLGMKYAELIPVLVNAIQEQQQEITELRNLIAENEFQIEDMEVRLARLEALVSGQGAAANTQTSSLTSRTAQAANKIQTCFPNPVNNILTVALEKAVADENTWISLFDPSGREVKKANLNAGENSQQLVVNDLAAGVYTLSLFLNGSSSNSMQVVIAR